MNEELIDSIKNLHQEVTELRNEQTEFRVSITKYVTSMSRDTEWVREKMDNINEKLDKCGFCSNPEEVTNFKKTVKKLEEEQTKVKWIAIGAASILSVIITTIIWFMENKNIIIP